MSHELAVGDAVTVNADPNRVGVVVAIEPVEEEGLLLTLDLPTSGQVHLFAADVTRVDKPQVQAGQIWTCDQTGTVVRALATEWYSVAAWSTETLAPAGRHVGTIILGHPAWRLVES